MISKRLWVRLGRLLPALMLAAALPFFSAGAFAQEGEAAASPLTVTALAPGENGVYTAVAAAEGLFDQAGETPLYNVTLELALTGTEEGEAPAPGAALASLCVNGTSAAAMTVQAWDASGAALGEQRTLMEGKTLSLPAGVCGLSLRYYSAESDFKLLPAGFLAGQVELSILYEGARGDEPGPVAVLRLNGSMELQGQGGTLAALPEVQAAVAFAAQEAAEEQAAALTTAAGPAVQETASTQAAATATPAPTAAPTPAPTATPEPTATPAPRNATVAGFAYADENGSLTREENEPLLGGVEVLLQKLENGAWTNAASSVTDEYGQYTFEMPAGGEYRVCAYTDAADYYVAAVGGQLLPGDAPGVMCSASLLLQDGGSSAGEADISMQRPALLTVTAFLDGNGDGQRGSGENGAEGIRVEVLDGESVLASGVTGQQGELTLGGIRPGEHVLRVTPPDGMILTVQGADSVVGDEGNPDGSALSGAFSFVAGQTVQAGVAAAKIGSFGGKVFEDLNNDGVMDEGDPGVAGVVLRLEGQKHGNIYQLTTDETGVYCFGRVQNDRYTFSAVLPEGMLFARYSKTGGDLRSVFSGSVLTREFPVSNNENVTDKNVGVVQNGVLAGMAFLDLNYNGYLDEGEPGYGGVTLEAIKISNNEAMGRTQTLEDGSFRLEGLRGGNYRLRAILPGDGSIFTIVPAQGGDNANYFEQRGSRRENTIEPINILSGGEASALVGVAVGATVRGVVFEDTNYDGLLGDGERRLSGVAVQAADPAGNIAASGYTGSDGQYVLRGLMPGTYTLQVRRIAGDGFTRLRATQEGGSHVVELIGDFGVTAPMEIAMGQTLEGINAGMLPASTVTGSLFNDLNDDGLLTEGEGGLVGANVNLRSQDGETDLTRPVGEDGTYFFDGVMPGDYTLTYQLPEHTEIARVAQGGNTLENQGRETSTGVFQVAMGQAYQCPLVGGVVLGSFEGLAFRDANANGVQDEGEAPLSGVTVTLAPDRGTAQEQSVVTGNDGVFALTGLRPAQYKLTLEMPQGYIFSHSIDGDGLNLPARQTGTLSCAWEALTNRTAKPLGGVKPASIAGAVWLDEDQDGKQAKEEALMADLSLELLDEATQSVVARTQSTGEGFLFENVRPGAYTLRFTLPAQSQPANDPASTFAYRQPYMEQRGITLAEGQQAEGLSTGLVSQTSIGGKAILEENGAAPVAGVTVTLYRAGESSPLQTTVTGDDGSYRFDGLWPDQYQLEAGLPEGMIFVQPDDPNFQPGETTVEAIDGSKGRSGSLALKMAQHQLSQNVLYIRPAKLGDQVWLDENQNGLMDGGEPLLAGVKIALMQEGKAVYETVSDAYGYYLFDAVYPGTYILQAQAYPQLGIAAAVPSLRIISSCLTGGDGQEAASDAFSVESGSADMNYNLGYVLASGQTLPPEATATPTQRDWSLSNEKYTAMQQ